MKILIYFSIICFQIIKSKGEPSWDDFVCNCSTNNEPNVNLNQIALGFAHKFNFKTISGVCQGIIINYYYVLTSASCIERYAMNGAFLYKGNGYTVNVSENILTNEENRVRDPKYIYHPSYESSSSEINHYKYDFALVYLNKRYINLDSDHFRAACFSFDKKLYRKLRKKVVGFGSRDIIKMNEKGLILDEQQHFNDFLTVLFFDKVSITKKYANQLEQFKNLCLDRNLFCLESTFQTCVGDEGSPLIMIGDKFSYAIGLSIKPPPHLFLDRTYGICVKGEVSYFSRLEYAIEFMEAIIGIDKLCYETTERKSSDFETEILEEVKENCDCFTNNVYGPITSSPQFDKRYSGTPIPNKTFEFHFSAYVYSLENDQKNCLGTVIGARELLVPADCIEGTNADKLKVYSELIYKSVTDYRSRYPANYVKGLEYFIHPDYKNNKFKYNIAVLRTQFELKGGTIDSVFHPFKQACLSNENENYSIKNDFFVLPNNGYDHSVVILRDKLFSRLQLDLDCNTELCFKYLNILIEQHGHPLFRVTKGHFDLFGLYLKNKSKGDHLIFVNINKEINWIRNAVGFYKVCKRKEANRIVNENQCTCTKNYGSSEENIEYIVNIVTYVHNYNPKIICKGVLLNEFYVLTLASCLNVFEERSFNFYVYSSIYKYLSVGKFKSYLALNLVVQVDEIIKHPNYTMNQVENDIVLMKLKNGLLIGNKPIQLSCFVSSSSNYINEPNDNIIYQKKNFVAKLKLRTKFFNTSDEVYCDSDNFFCFDYDDRYCKIDSGNPVILIRENMSVIVGLISTKADEQPLEKCGTIPFIKALKINTKIEWISSVIGFKSFCTYKNKKTLPECYCNTDSNYVTIGQRYQNTNRFKLLCQATIINKYWVITSAQCLLRREGTIIINKNYNTSTFDIDSIEKQTIDIEKIIYHELINDEDIEVEFVKKTNYKVILIKLKASLTFGNDIGLHPACFGNTKFPYRAAYLGKTLSESVNLKKLELGSKEFDSKDKICLLKEVMCFENDITLCKSDQGKAINTYGLQNGYRTIGFLLNPTNRLRKTSIPSNDDKKCFKSYFFTGFFVDVNADWLNKEVIADGICHYKEENENDLCNCKFVQPFIGRITNSSEEVRDIVRFLAYIFLNNNNQSSSFQTQDYRFIASGVILNEYWVLTSNVAGIEKFIPENIYVGFGDKLNLNNYHYFETLRKVSYYKTFMSEGTLLILRMQDPIVIGPESNIFPACIKSTIPSKSMGSLIKVYGFAKSNTNDHLKQMKIEDLPIITNFVYDVVRTFSVKIDSEDPWCKKDEFCLEVENYEMKLNLLDTGGPLVFFTKNKLQVAGIITPFVENHTVKEIRPSNNFIAKRIGYYWSWIKQQTLTSDFCYEDVA